jgi:CBS domain containing-hemolysin-like protein
MLTALAVLFVVGLLVGANALYVAGEFASVSARRARIAQMAYEGNRLAQTVLPVLENPRKLDNYIAASQVGITLSSITLGIYGQQQIAPLIEPWPLYRWAGYHLAVVTSRLPGLPHCWS